MTKSDWLEDGGTNILQLLKCPKCKKRSINYSCSRGMAATCFYFCENQDCLSLIAAGGAVGIADAASTAGKVGTSIATGGVLGAPHLDVGGKFLSGAADALDWIPGIEGEVDTSGGSGDFGSFWTGSTPA